MHARPLLLCPVDFSDESRTALQYAAAIADHFAARVIVLTVDHPLLVDAAAAYGDQQWLVEQAEDELRLFVQGIGVHGAPSAVELEFRVALGQPASEILRVARETNAELIVMSSRGNSGFRKLFFGSTTERVLRETKAPVLVTPSGPGAPATLEEIGRRAKRVIAPVDLTPASRHQMLIAAGISAALSIPLVLMHVIEPLRLPSHWRAKLPSLGLVQRSGVEESLADLAAELRGVQTETLVAYGEASEEIAKVADVRGAAVIVMGLHSSAAAGPRMGSVTYRVLCLSHGLVLAWPPGLEPSARLKPASASGATRP